MRPEDVPSWRVVLQDGHLMVPIAVLVWLLVERWSGNFAAFAAICTIMIVSTLKASTRMSAATLFDTLSSAAGTMAVLAVAVAGAGVITSALTVTGLVVAFGGIIKGLAGGSLALLCMLLMVTALILGMGVPTTPAYIITAALGAPLLTEMGVQPIAAHLFMLYFAVLADATPPVAVASYAAAAIAQCNPMAAGMQAVRFALAGFVVGYAFIYDRGILLIGPLVETIEETAILATSLILVGAAMGAWFRHALAAWARPLVLAVGLAGAFAHMLPDHVRLFLVTGAAALLWLLPRFFAPRDRHA